MNTFEGPKKEEPEKQGLTRRDFLKKAAIVGGAVAAGAAISKFGIDRYENAEKFEREHTHEGEGVVLKKEERQKPIIALPIGDEMLAVPGGIDYIVHISVDGHEGDFYASPEQYKALSEGDTARVTYVTNDSSKDIEIKSLQ